MNRFIDFLATRFLPSADIATVQDSLKVDRKADYLKRLLWNALPYSNYGYGIYHSANLAKKLKVPRSVHSNLALREAMA